MEFDELDKMGVDDTLTTGRESRKDARLNRAIAERKEHAECNYDFDDDGAGFTDDDAIKELMGECGQDKSGFCSLAGTEYCDWDCPFS